MLYHIGLKTFIFYFYSRGDKMFEDFLRETVRLIVGKNAEEIAKLLNKEKHVNEFLIAKKLNLTVNQTRNLLYKLSDKGVVSHIRKKDEKKGWYTYFWRMEKIKSLEFLKKNTEQRKEQVFNQIQSREAMSFYVCDTCNIEVNDENALLSEFTCPECGEVFKLKDNSKLLRELKKNYNKLEVALEELNKELNLQEESVEKVREKERKKVEEEKKEIRRKRREENKKSSGKLAKVSSKKGVSKIKQKKATKKKNVKKIKKVSKPKKLQKKKVPKKPQKRKVSKKKK